MTAEAGLRSGSLLLLPLVAERANIFLNVIGPILCHPWLGVSPFAISTQGEAMVPSLTYLFLKKCLEVVLLIGLGDVPVSFIQ